MYAYISGEVDQITSDRAVIEAAGVGYELLCSSNTLRTLSAGGTARLFTHLHLAEGVMALYGFADMEEREMFRRLIGITRVGPKLALSVLSAMTPRDVASAVFTNNAAAFDRVPGLGRKTAQRVLLELKEKVTADDTLPGAESPDASKADIRAEAVAALLALGYEGLAASRAVTNVQKADTVEELIKAALRSLAK